MIKRIQIENFKSFGNVDLEPHPRVNLLIGPNSSGKSNFLEALRFGGGLEGNLNGLEDIWTKIQSTDNQLLKTGSFVIDVDFQMKGRILGLFNSVKISKIHNSLWFGFQYKDVAHAFFQWEKYKGGTNEISNMLSLEECDAFFNGLRNFGVVQYHPNSLKMRDSVKLRKDFLLNQ